MWMSSDKPVLSRFIMLALAAALAGCAASSNQPDTTAQAAPPLRTQPTVGQELGAVVDNKVQINFPQGGATLTPAADKQLDLAARLFRDANPVVMFTTGYTDQSGDEYANLLLSARRAQAVKRGLIARGIPPERLLIQALGESELADSRDPVGPANRRVVITWRLL